MAREASLLGISNPVVTKAQLLALHEVHLSRSNSDSLIFTISLLTQSAGILLGLPQETIATSIIVLQRYLHSEPDHQHDYQTISAAAVYLCAKQSFYALSPRSIVNVYAYLTSCASPLRFVNTAGPAPDATSRDYYVTPGTYERQRQNIFAAESAVLAALGFDSSVVLPHKLALTYIQSLLSNNHSEREVVAQRAFEHLNGALLSPQLLYLTHQPCQLAVAAIYLAAKEIGVKMPEVEWWVVFDVEREDLGFLVLSLCSLDGFVEAEKEKWTEGQFKLVS